MEDRGRTTFIEFPVFFQGVIDGSTSSSPQGSSSASESQSNFELRFGGYRPAFRVTFFFTGILVALADPARVESLIDLLLEEPASYQSK
jgi:hypothetical protein